MFRFFQETETHPEAKSMAEYYEDLEAAVHAVYEQISDADNDPAFRQAASVLMKIVTLCHNLESVPALEARDINNTRSALLKTIGTDGLIDVKGDASRLLAQKYADLVRDVVNKVYWPVDTCPTFLGQSFLTVYAAAFEERVPRMQNSIDKLEARIEAYDHAKMNSSPGLALVN